MPYYSCTGVIRFEALQQFPEGIFLRRGTCIGGLPVRIQSPFVADTDGMTVITRCMRPHLIEGATCMDGSVTGHIIMIAYRCESARPVTGDDGFQRKAPVAARRTAMHHYQVNPTVILVLAAVQYGITHLTAGLKAEGGRNGSKYSNDYFQDLPPDIGGGLFIFHTLNKFKQFLPVEWYRLILHRLSS